ncbi:MAG: hypothetical protein M3O70_17135, partial [Actinomycetota bacterium]|nr:hypothetical protein [Actinomycetota bacterium]
MSAGTATASRAPARTNASFARAGWMGGAVVAVVGAAAVLAPVVAPYRPTALAGPPLQPPGWTHPLGTNGVGQDVLSQLLSGARVSLLIAVLAGLATALVGALVGL